MDLGASRSPDGDKITVKQSDGYFVAKDEETGVSSQGKTKSEALGNLAEAIALYEEPVPQEADEDLQPSSAPWF